MPHERNEEMREHLEAWKVSRLTQIQYCQKNNIKFITGCIEQLFKVEMSTMIVSKTTVSWWYGILEAIVQQRRNALVNRLPPSLDQQNHSQEIL